MRLEPEKAQKMREKIARVYEALLKDYPGITSKLLESKKGNPVDVLIATVLSQATNDILSERAFERLKKSFDTWSQILTQDQHLIEEALSCGGLQREKTKKIKAILKRIQSDFGEIWLEPLKSFDTEKAFSYLLSLPGVGPKTAACTLAFGFHRPAFPVDTHIARILKRLGLVPVKDSAVKVQKEMEGIVPEEMKIPLHVMLIQHGREVCGSRTPKCGKCSVRKECQFGGKIAPAVSS